MDVGAIISIADVASRVCLRLAHFINDASNVVDTRNRLLTNVATLRDLLESVRTSAGMRTSQLHAKPVNDEESAILECLTSALNRCESTVEQLDMLLQELGGGVSEPNWLERAMLQMSLDYRGSGIERLEKEMQQHIAAIKLLFECLSPFVHERTLTAISTGNRRTEQYLVKIQAALERHSQILDRLSQQRMIHRTGLAATGTVEISSLDRRIKEVALSFVEIITTRGTVVGQTTPQGSAWGSGTPSTQSGGVRISTHMANISTEGSIDDQDDSSLNGSVFGHAPFNQMASRLHDLELTNELLDGYRSKAKSDLLSGHFAEARDNLLWATEQGVKREQVHNHPFDEKLEIGIGLVEAYIGLGDFCSAESELRSLVSIARPLHHGMLLYWIARLHRERFHYSRDEGILDQLLESAQRSYNLALNSEIKPQPFLKESAEILAQAHECKGDLVGARIFRERHPSVECPRGYAAIANSGIGHRARPQNNRSIGQHDMSSSRPSIDIPTPPTATPSQSSTQDTSGPDSSSTQPTTAEPDRLSTVVTANLLAKVREGDAATTEILIKTCGDIEQIDDRGLTPLLVAAKYKHFAVVKVLLKDQVRTDRLSISADIRAKDPAGCNVLHHALCGSGPEDMIFFLIEKGADLNAKDKNGRTPLHYCVENNKCRAAIKLLRNGADKEATDKTGETPLTLAFRMKRLEPVVVLVHAGAKIEDLALNKSSPDIKYNVAEYRRELEEKCEQAKIKRQISNRTAASRITIATTSSKSSSRKSSWLVRPFKPKGNEG